jgi:hypothetical protein
LELKEIQTDIRRRHVAVDTGANHMVLFKLAESYKSPKFDGVLDTGAEYVGIND